MNLRLLDFEEANQILNESNKNQKNRKPSNSNSDKSIYLVKYMKKSGKPDMDLPGFELNTPVENFKVNQFALSYDA